MSLYVDQIVKDIMENPYTFKDNEGQGLKKDNIEITGYGNGRVFSLIYLFINDKSMPITYIDCWRLESAIKLWYSQVPLSVVSAI